MARLMLQEVGQFALDRLRHKVGVLAVLHSKREALCSLLSLVVLLWAVRARSRLLDCCTN
jgi:hypothetical protein